LAKFLMSVGEETLRVLTTEAEKRNVRVQQLIRAVIVPEWVRNNLTISGVDTDGRETAPKLTRPSVYNMQEGRVLQASMDRVRRR
jgi:hypothetical protein